MDNISVDINADVGEGLNNEVHVMPYLSSCNIACGGHAGDNNTMASTIKQAIANNVKIGVHPSFPDKANFGRLQMLISDTDLFQSITSQITAFQTILKTYNGHLNHLKPHGALYNLAAQDERIAKIIVGVVQKLELPIKLYAPYKSALAELAIRKNIGVVYEAFADRNYNDDLSLVSRRNPRALLSNPTAVLNHVLNMILHGKVRTVSSEEIPIDASTFCVHGDTKNAIKILQHLNKELPKYNIIIQ